jgi:L-ascorbate metabolism protein UlaG (beta-lactamase superfamily)
VSGCISGPGFDGTITDHFDGRRFFHPWPVPARGFGDFLRWRFSREAGQWQEQTEAAVGPRPPERVPPGSLRVTFIHHSTLLIQLDGLNLLTDPIFSERASPVSWAGPRRARPAGLRFEDLPPIDALLISHDHYDHLDLATLRRLREAGCSRVVTGLGNGRLLKREGVASRVDELDWWQGVELTPAKGGPPVRVTAVPAQHFSGRGLDDRNETLWVGFVLEGAAGRLLFAGDTGYGPHFRQIRERFGPLEMAALPIGAYRPEWFMAPMHMSPDDAVRALIELQAGRALAIHFGTFPLADDDPQEPLRDLEVALQRHGVPAERFWVPGFGEGKDCCL